MGNQIESKTQEDYKKRLNEYNKKILQIIEEDTESCLIIDQFKLAINELSLCHKYGTKKELYDVYLMYKKNLEAETKNNSQTDRYNYPIAYTVWDIAIYERITDITTIRCAVEAALTGKYVSDRFFRTTEGIDT